MHSPRLRTLLLRALPAALAVTLGAAVAVGPAPVSPAAAGTDAGSDTGADTGTPEIVVEPVPEVSDAERRRAARAAEVSATAQETGLPALHSLPGSSRTILLDLDGHTVTGSQWAGLPDPWVAAPWSLDTDPAISATEAARIRDVWAAVAEDFAPFDVDVTTVDPGPAGLERSTSADQTYGVRVLISDTDTWRTVCGGSRCGGVAFVDVFDRVRGTGVQTAWVFGQNMADDARMIADAASHEVGHTLGLSHDGRTSPAQEYYGGQGLWQPIMGSSGGRPLSQWSSGEYAGASNTEDDTALIAAGGTPLLPDDAGDSAADAAAGLPSDTRVIGTRGDTDWYRLTGCTGDLRITATPAAAPDLDVDLRVLDAAGRQVAAADPTSARTSSTTASGLDATVSVPGASGTYYVRVDGTGSGSPITTGYSDYGSLGRYRLSMAGGSCSTPVGLPGVPQLVSALAGLTQVTVSWQPPASSGTSAVTGYKVTAWPLGTVLTTGPEGRSVVFGGLARLTSLTFTVVALNASGAGPAGSAQATTSAGAPGAVASATLAGDGTWTSLSWTPPADDGGSEVTGYRVQVGPVDQLVGADVSALKVSGLRGTVTGTVSAVNAVGTGPATSQTIDLGGVPAAGAPGAAGKQALVATVAPALAGRAVVGGRVTVRPGRWTPKASLTYRWRLGTRVVGTGAAYRVRPGDVGKRLAVTLTASSGGQQVSVVLRTPKVTRR